MCPCSAHSYHPHAIHGERLIDRLFLVVSIVLTFIRVSLCLLPLLYPTIHLYPDLHSFHVDSAEANNHCNSANRGVLPLARIHSSHMFHLSTVFEWARRNLVKHTGAPALWKELFRFSKMPRDTSLTANAIFFKFFHFFHFFFIFSFFFIFFIFFIFSIFFILFIFFIFPFFSFFDTFFRFILKKKSFRFLRGRCIMITSSDEYLAVIKTGNECQPPRLHVVAE